MNWLNEILVTVKPADKTRRAYQRMISTRLHRGFQMFRSPKPAQDYQPQQHPLLNVSSGEDAFV